MPRNGMKGAMLTMFTERVPNEFPTRTALPALRGRLAEGAKNADGPTSRTPRHRNEHPSHGLLRPPMVTDRRADVHADAAPRPPEGCAETESRSDPRPPAKVVSSHVLPHPAPELRAYRCLRCAHSRGRRAPI